MSQEQVTQEKEASQPVRRGSTTRVPETEEEKAERLARQQEIDSRSIYVGNVEYQSTPEQLEEFFHIVGIIERVTILFDKFSGLPKGYAYVEFEKLDSVQKAVDELHGKQFRGREIKVVPKRTNLPGFRKRGRGGRGRGGSRRGDGGGDRGGYRGGDRGGRKQPQPQDDASNGLVEEKNAVNDSNETAKETAI
ncbi:hypothetical protein KGF56_003713 [Candida oxycetoniae]|uniref:RRM domain-containing protein n=1 Tax=Candida oxycetoniae TaxID=497107 RepID=A0AAI9WWY5_9ASCO|nr:uncharacterized protein KGF56_003713 [Candida oxycetoniae]KAI3403429.1 hypothetical protein KGF56_003713 [Candida oxycetoniae]